MTMFGKIGALAVAGMLFTTGAFASTVNITAMDVGRGDGVMFTVTYDPFTDGTGIQCDSGADCISSLFFDLTATEGETNARFGGGDYPARQLSGKGLRADTVSAAVSDTPDANGEYDRSTRNALTFSFAPEDFDPGNQLSFLTWIQGLSGGSNGNGGGIDNAASELYASVTLENGQSASGFFVNSAPGKASLTLDFGSVSEVPLPASALLLLGGVAGLGAMRRRKTA